MGLGEGWRQPRELPRAGSSSYCPEQWHLLNTCTRWRTAKQMPWWAQWDCSALPCCLTSAYLWPTLPANSPLLILFPLTRLKGKPPFPADGNSSNHPLSLTHCQWHIPLPPVGHFEGSSSPIQIFSSRFQQKIPSITLDETVRLGQCSD